MSQYIELLIRHRTCHFSNLSKIGDSARVYTNRMENKLILKLGISENLSIPLRTAQRTALTKTTKLSVSDSLLSLIGESRN